MKYMLLVALCLASLAHEINAGQLLISNVQIQWMNRGTYTDFYVSSPLGHGVSANQAWLGIGFNSQKKMFGADVVVCKIYNGKSAVHHYKNSYTSRSSVLFDENRPSVGITNGVVSSNGGSVLTCSFSRDNLNPIENYYHINETSRPYFLVAYGVTTSTGEIQKHVFRDMSPDTQSFIVPTAKNQARFADVYKNRTYSLNWKPAENYTTFDFKTDLTNLDSNENVYSAFALSNDRQIDHDDICVCVYSEKVKDVFHYINLGNQSVLMNETNPSIGLSHVHVNLDNNMLTCQFRRINSMRPKVNYYIDTVSRPYYIIMASGHTKETGELDEPENITVSRYPVYLNKYLHRHHFKGQMTRQF